MRPTEQAEFYFVDASLIAGQVLNRDDAPQYARDLALAISSVAAGLKQLSIGLRATYLLLEQARERQERPSAGTSQYPSA